MPEALLWATGSGSAGVSFTDALRGVLAAFVFGQVLAFAYERTYTGVSYARGFAHTIVLTSLAASTFVMAIGRSLYAGLGLLGVLSIIRFRANLKAPRDLVFLLGAASSGVACGIDALPVAVVGTVAFALVSVYLHYSSFASQREYDGVLRFSMRAGDERESRLPALLGKHCVRSTALSVAEIAQGGVVEYTYQIKLKPAGQAPLLAALRTELDVRDARLLLEEASLEY
jgi:hypothetical protein